MVSPGQNNPILSHSCYMYFICDTVRMFYDIHAKAKNA